MNGEQVNGERLWNKKMRREQRVKAASKPSAWQSVACGLDVCQENWGRSEKSPTSKCCTGVLLGCANTRFEW